MRGLQQALHTQREHLHIASRSLQMVISMTSESIRELYVSPNGDRWSLCRNSAGSFMVSHRPNASSGGQASQTEVANFLASGSRGPEHQALLHALTELGMHAGHIDLLPAALPQLAACPAACATLQLQCRLRPRLRCRLRPRLTIRPRLRPRLRPGAASPVRFRRRIGSARKWIG